MKLLTVIALCGFIIGSVYVNDVRSQNAQIPRMDTGKVEVETAREILNFIHKFRNLFTTCTACDTVSRMLKNPEAVDSAKEHFRSYCGDVHKKFQKFCHAVVEKSFYIGLEYVEKLIAEDKCEMFCGTNEKPIGQEFICESVQKVYKNIDFLVSLLESKVASVCQTDKNPESCLDGFKKWKSHIAGFFQRSTLRISREVDPKGFCGLDVSEIPRSEQALASPRIFEGNQNESLGCTLCQYEVNYACTMITGPYNLNTYNQEATCLIYTTCVQILNGTTTDCPPTNPVEPCNTIAGYVNQFFPIVCNIMNIYIWPQVCHAIDSSCPVNPNTPMCHENPPSK